MFLILVSQKQKKNHNQETVAASCSERPTEIEEEEIGEVTASFAAAAAAKVISMTAAVVRLYSAKELMLFYCTSRKHCVTSG